MKPDRHIPALDGLRGLAILFVLLYHASPRFSGGFLGVDLFFVLSGFLITNLLLEEWGRAGTISLRRFYERRARRLLPAALTAIFVFELLLFAAGKGLSRDSLGGLAAAFYVENLGHFANPPIGSALGHYWSLSQEEQFYFLWPPLLLLLLRLRVSRRSVAAGLAFAFLAVVAHRATLAHDWYRVYYAPDTRSDGIVLGCLIAVAWNSGRLRGYAWRMFALPALGVLAAELALLHKDSAASGLYGLLLANLAAGVLVIAAASAGWVGQLLSIAPLRWLGAISYGIYIWSGLVGHLTGGNGWLTAAISIGVACLSYRYIEHPFRLRRKARLEPTAVPT